MISRIKKSLTALPATLGEAISYLSNIGRTQIAINKANADAKGEIAGIKARLEKELAPLIKERDAYFTGLYAFAQAKRVDLTKLARSVRLASGVFGWRWTPPYVEVTHKGGEEAVITYLRKAGMEKYLRVTYELDREAMLVDHPKVPGVEYSQREEFFAKPKLAKAEGRSNELKQDTGETQAIDV